MVFGNSRLSRDVSMLAYPALHLSITSPQTDAVVANPTVQVTGTVSGGASVTINGQT